MEEGSPAYSFNYPCFADLRDRNKVFSHLVATAERPVGFSTGQSTERLSALFVSGDYFRMLGLDAALGRMFVSSEGLVIGDAPVAVISHRLWERRFGADPLVIGRSASVNGRPFTVIGVAPREFIGTQRGSTPDLYLPMTLYGQLIPRNLDGEDPLTSRQLFFHEVIGRLREGVSRETSQVELRTLAAGLRAENPNPDDQISTNLLVLPGAQGFAGELRNVRLPLNLLFVTAMLVLLIACANLANLQLARGLSRSREFAIRLSLGATRGRVIRGLLAESLMLALIGGIAGLLLACWLGPLLERFRPPGSTFQLSGGLDWRLLLFAMAASVLTGLLFGLLPAWRSSRPQLTPELKGSAGETATRSRLPLRNLLVTGQVALAVLVLTGAGLCVQSLVKLRSVGSEFEPARLVLLSADPDLNNYSEARAREFYRELLERARAIPGVESVSLSRSTPMSGRGIGMSVDRIEGYEMKPGEWAMADVNVVAPGFFRTLHIPLLQGRDFDSRDEQQRLPTVIVNETFARRYWADGSAVGKRIYQDDFKGGQTAMEIVGVVRTSSYKRPVDPESPMMFRPLAQWNEKALTLVARAGIEPATVLGNLQGLVRKLDANLPVFDGLTLAQQQNDSLAMQRMAATLLTVFGGLALFLAAFGLYGLLIYSVSRRTREIGVRVALGASVGAVVRLILRQGLGVALAGALAGLMAAIGLTRAVRSFLFGVSPLDPVTFGTVILLLTAVATVACWLPARRAARVDPMEALRQE
jgi:predicted permease